MVNDSQNKNIIVSGDLNMKKKLFIFVFLFFLSINLVNKPVFAVNSFTEGVYKAADLNFSEKNKYIVQNISNNESTYLQVFDENQIILQSIRLEPNSEKFNLVKLSPDYRIVLVGKGTTYIFSANE